VPVENHFFIFYTKQFNFNYIFLENIKMLDGLKWSTTNIEKGEELIHEQSAINVYKSDHQSVDRFRHGKLKLTSHRLIWQSMLDTQCRFEISLQQIVNIELKQLKGVSKDGATSRMNRSYDEFSSRIQIDFNKLDSKTNSTGTIQFEFEYGGHNEFKKELTSQLTRKHWLYSSQQQQQQQQQQHGITGIQRQIQSRLDTQGTTIENSFKDLNILMNKAKEMVNLSNVLITKINKKNEENEKGESEEDNDLKELKGYFQNMGIIDSPVTKETSSSSSKYYKDLAIEINNYFSKIIANNGGIMTLSDVFCRLNRARSMGGLVSADDLLNACKMLNKLETKLRYNVYTDLNLHVLETTHSNEKLVEKIQIIMKKNDTNCISAFLLSKFMDCSLIVARKHLLDGEQIGKFCRDDTTEGLLFYNNLFESNIE
jgi:ESCRT-II complex subunit VPS36